MTAKMYRTGFERVFDNPAGRHILALTRAAQRGTADGPVPRVRTDDGQPTCTPQPCDWAPSPVRRSSL